MPAHESAASRREPALEREQDRPPTPGEPPPRRRSEAGVHRLPAEVLGTRGAVHLLAILLAAMVGITVVVAARWQPLMGVDHSIAQWGYDSTYGHAGRVAWWTTVDRYTEPILLRIVMGGIAAYQAWRRRWALAGWLVGVAVVQNFVAPGSKYLLDRPRPHWPDPIVTEHTTSFPAGHPAGSAMFATALILLALVTAHSPAVRRLVIVVVVALAVLVSVDRLVLGLHYLSDVVAGALLGVTVTVAGWVVMLRLSRSGPLAEPEG